LDEQEKEEVERRAAMVARQSFGRLVALVASRNGDIAGAEDALAEALRHALESWPVNGLPRNPEAWLLTFARRRRVDAIRHRVVQENATPELQLRVPTIFDVDARQAIPDERLKLLFVCAHPAIDEALRTPLMLQTVLGFEAADIAHLYITSGSAMAQRLVRAKRKIAEARIPFVVPERGDMPMRVAAVLEAVYGICAWHWSFSHQALLAARPMLDEAVYLAELVAKLLPEDPEALGLAALVNYLAARRQPPDEQYVPLDERGADHWDSDRVRHAEALLRRAHDRKCMGRFQLEAAIQSAHASRAQSASVDWEALCVLHEGLARIAPTAGGLVAQAIALCHARGPDTGLAALGRLDPSQVENFQPYWAARAFILGLQGQRPEANLALDRTLSLTSDALVRQYLETRRT
jgi:RNA polymerase sigma-70 factor (ECF subfamily)